MCARHWTEPSPEAPFPSRPAIVDQGWRFWAAFAAVVLLTVTFVIFFGWWAVRQLDEYDALIEMIGREWPT